MKKSIFLTILFLGLYANSIAQESDSIPKNNYLRVYLYSVSDNSNFISNSENYIRVKLWYVNYVRDPKEAQVHIIINSQPTASGGSQYSIRFIGREKFESKNDTLNYIAPFDNSNRDTRDQLTNVITMGLMPYLAANGQQKHMVFDYTDRSKLIEQSIDKWNNWVYTATLNSYLTGDKVSQVFVGDGSLSAAKITDAWKSRLTVGGSYGSNNYETTTYNYAGSTKIYFVNGLEVKSLNEHWSLGLDAGFYSSTFSNIKSQYAIAPGIEYDLFPYVESINRLFTFKYRIRPLYNTYFNETVYYKNTQFLLSNILDVTYTHINTWGNISSTLTAQNYMNVSNAYRFDLVTQMNFRVAKGLFFNVTGNVSYINNQLSLSSQSVSNEEIILKQRETLTNYSYGLVIGINYSFGSIFNNIVNPRYEGGLNITNEITTAETAD